MRGYCHSGRITAYAFAVMMLLLQLAALCGCDSTQPPVGAEEAVQQSDTEWSKAALDAIPAAVGTSVENILAWSFEMHYSPDGEFEGGAVTVWRYNSTYMSEDHWTRGIIAISPEGAVSFEVEYEDIQLLSKYSPMLDRSLIPITEIFAKIDETAAFVNDSLNMTGDYLLTHGVDEHVIYVSSAGSEVTWYSSFEETEKPPELSEYSYMVDGKYCFVLAAAGEQSGSDDCRAVFMFDR